jgi:hypothetical protein
MIATMSEMDVKALQANFDLWCEDRAAGLTKSKAFERYVFEQVLKDHDPADEDLDVGDFGDGNNGGVDGMYLYMGGQLIGLETPAPLSASEVELHIIQAKHETGFKETTVEKLESFSRDLLSYDKPVDQLTYLNSKARDLIANFRTKYEQMLGRTHKFSIWFHYACVASEIPGAKDKIMVRAENLTRYVKSVLTLADVHFSTWAAQTLLESARSIPIGTIVLPYSRLFSAEDQSTVCLVKLIDFAKIALSKPDGTLQTRFLEPNVRDYQGKTNPVNEAIRKTLENRGPEDFWWLNNGITILATSCGISGDKVKIDDPEIVNGLQTSHEVFSWSKTWKEADQDSRRILIRVIVPSDDKSRIRIIKATNSQTKVSDLSLLSTEPIQQTIEDRLRLNGLFYDRKKGQCRRLRRPVKKVIGIRTLAQAVISIVLREPDQARGRPETFVKNNAKRVFDPDAEGDLFAACVVLDRRVAEFLSNSALPTDEQRNLRYYIDMFLISSITEQRNPDPNTIAAKFDSIQTVSDGLVQSAVDEVSKIFHAQGASIASTTQDWGDQVAKSREMTAAVETVIAGLW